MIRLESRMAQRLRAASFLAVAGALAACGGGGGGSSVAPNPGPSSTPSKFPNSATITLIIPVGKQSGSATRKPQFVSPNSANLDLVINSVNGNTTLPSAFPRETDFALTKGGNCTDHTTFLSCTLTIPAPPGTVSYTFTVTDAAKNPLSIAQDVAQSIVEGAANNLTVTLLGIVNSVTITGSVVANTPSNAPLAVTVADKSGASIDNTNSANYFNPVTLTDNDPSGQTQLCQGAVCGSTATLNSPGDLTGLTLKYTGQGVNPFTITATAGAFTANAFSSSNVNDLTPSGGSGTIGSTVQDVTFTGTTIATVGPGVAPTDPDANQQTLSFSQAGGSQMVGAAELGWTNGPFNRSFSIALDASGPFNCTNIATVTPSTGTTFSVTAGTKPGFCRAKVSETGVPGTPLTGHPASVQGTGPTRDGVFWIVLTTGGVNVNDRHRHAGAP